jgi:hypothetical protein
MPLRISEGKKHYPVRHKPTWKYWKKLLLEKVV